MRPDISRAEKAVQSAGIMLVFSIPNKTELPSLWSYFHPRSKMRWEWDNDGDDRVAKLWHLRTEMALRKKVIYTKWYQGRATFFSKDVFESLASFLGSVTAHPRISATARNLLEILKDNSPQSTKLLKKTSQLRGKMFEAVYTAAMKELWQKLLIVGMGEIDDGAFPSLAIGSSELLFEDIWKRAQLKQRSEALHKLKTKLGTRSPFLNYALKMGSP